MVPGIFKLALSSRGRGNFMWQPEKVLNVFNTLISIQISWKMKTFFKKLKYCFLVETNKIQLVGLKTYNFHSKLLFQKKNVTTNRMATTKWTYQKKWRFASNCFIFSLKICFSFRTSYKELIWCTSDPNIHIRIFWKRWSLILGWFFPVSILKRSILNI